MESIPHPQIDVVAPDDCPQLRELAGELGLDVVASASDSSAGLLLLEHAGRLSLVKAGGGKVAGGAFLVEIEPLGGRERLVPHRVESVLQY